MNTARESAVRLLKLMMIASLVLPAALYAYAAWVSYRDTHAAADERIERSLDVQQEQALKVFETVDRTFAEVDEVVRGMSDDQIRAAQATLHPRLERISGVMPQLQAIVLVGRDGRPMASSALPSVKTDVNFTDRDYFKVQSAKDAGTYVSDLRRPNLSVVGTDFFDLSRRLESPDGSFNGVIAVAVRPKYFEDFYSLIGQTPGQFLRPGPRRRCDPGALSLSQESVATTQPVGGAAPRDQWRSYPGRFHRQFRSRWCSSACRFPQARRLSGLCAVGYQHLSDQQRVVDEHQRTFDLRFAGYAAAVRRAVDRASPYRAPAR